MTNPDHVVLCAPMLGGAEIFTLERMLRDHTARTVLCNNSLAQTIMGESRYLSLRKEPVGALDALACKITVDGVRRAARELAPLLQDGNVLLANLRAASVQLLSAYARLNDAFIHDNTHYLNLKTRALIAAIAVRSRTTFFPCRHSFQRLPLKYLLKSRLQEDYFGRYKPLLRIRPARPHQIRVINIGRIEPLKNQLLAVEIAWVLRRHFDSVILTFLGGRTDATYYSQVEQRAGDCGIAMIQKDVRRSQVLEEIARHDLVLHTSIAESLPLVLFEANSVGIPFFSLATGGIPEVLPADYIINPDPDVAAGQILETLFSS